MDRDNLFTIGMRGIHDGSMEGLERASLDEKTAALQQVIDDQRVLLQKHIDKDLTKIPQMFMPYKEVLEIMENGLRVPDDVTVVWCDDNYGNMTRLSAAPHHRARGGAGKSGAPPARPGPPQAAAPACTSPQASLSLSQNRAATQNGAPAVSAARPPRTAPPAHRRTGCTRASDRRARHTGPPARSADCTPSH